jgi:hypothetical protein
MTRAWFRRATALAVLVGWMGTVVLPSIAALHTPVLDDAACGDPLWSNPHPTTQFEAVLPSLYGEHCAVCHLQRALRGALASATRLPSPDDIAPAGRLLAAPGVLTLEVSAGPSRAPPITA